MVLRLSIIRAPPIGLTPSRGKFEVDRARPRRRASPPPSPRYERVKWQDKWRVRSSPPGPSPRPSPPAPPPGACTTRPREARPWHMFRNACHNCGFSTRPRAVLCRGCASIPHDVRVSARARYRRCARRRCASRLDVAENGLMVAMRVLEAAKEAEDDAADEKK